MTDSVYTVPAVAYLEIGLGMGLSS